MYKLFIIFLILNCTLSAQKINVGDQLFVFAENGLNMRDQPDLNGNKVHLLKKGDLVQVLDLMELLNKDTINNEVGYWIKVKYYDQVGFVFDIYLTSLPFFKLIKKDKYGNCYGQILYDLALEIGIVDSINYNNFYFDEPRHIMDIILLKGGHKFIRHNCWEDIINEIQLIDLSENEIDFVIDSLLSECNDRALKNKIKNSIANKNEGFYEGDGGCFHFLRIVKALETLVIEIKDFSGT